MRFIENLATIRINNASDAVEVNFFGSGDILEYRVAIQVGLDIAATYGVRKMVLIKMNFTDFDSLKFLSYIKEWLKPSFKNGEIEEISINTKIQAARKMGMLLKYNNLLNVEDRFTEKLKITMAVKEVATPVIMHQTA
jgi:hypothetical protein